ncbi:MAG: hypothetical protein F7C32_01610 [Desulfurococcales archaeon]|nr:hypothetical protein [Desulfurococcales archaeon]
MSHPTPDNDGKLQILSMYYNSIHLQSLSLPEDLRTREFAFQLFPDARFVRHLSFTEKEQVLEWIRGHLPHSAYYSAGLYQIPSAPKMSEKGQLGAELLFDIDVDHMKECIGKEFRLCNTPDSPILVPEECLKIGLEKAVILKERLEKEFGIKWVFIHFSGNRGFHIVARHEDMLKLTSDERKEILDYVMGVGLDLDFLFPRKRGYKRIPPSVDEPGWRGFLARLFHSTNTDGSPSFFEKLPQLIDAASVPADPQVTVDTSRLIRIPGSINGKSGLLVAAIEKPEKFDVKDYVPIKKPMLVKILCNINEVFDPGRMYKRNIVYRVEPFVGVSLVFRGAAKLLEIGV